MDLQALKKKIEDVKKRKSSIELEKAKHEAVRDSMLEQLVKDYGCSTLEEAEAKATKIEATKKELETKLATVLRDLEERLRSIELSL